MVDLDNLVTIANSGKHPILFNSSDADNVRSIVETYPDVFSGDFDNGTAIVKSPSSDAKYGFRFRVPTGISQYELFDGTLLDSKIFPYLKEFKCLFFQNGVFNFELVDLEPVPLFAPTIDALCKLATEITGNTDTSSLKGLLELLENITSEEHDYEVTTLTFSKLDKTIRIGLDKVSSISVSEDIFKYIGTRSNTKVYANIQGLTYSMDNLLDDYQTNSIQMYIEFNSTGLVKNLGYGIYPKWKKDEPERSSAQDNFPAYTEYQQSHRNSVANITNESKTRNWIPVEWADELSVWEDTPKAIHAETIVTASGTAVTTEIAYGIQTLYNRKLY